MRLTLVSSVFFLSAEMAAASPYKDIRDTAVYCTNGLTCDLSLKAKGEAKGLHSVSLSRKAGPETSIALVIRATSALVSTSDVVFSVDGEEALRFALADFDLYTDNFEYTAKEPDAGRKLFALIKDASSLRVAFNTDGPSSTEFSLSGVAGAGVYMDEVQGRLDARDALVRVGDKETPPSPVRDIAALEDLPAVLRLDFEGEDGACAFFDKNRFKSGSGFAVTLPDDVELYVLPCTDGGAYNQPYALYQISSGALSEVWLPTMTEDGPSTTIGATNVDWDQPTKTLTAFDKGRGLGDCGTFDTWKLRDVPGEASFALVESRVKGECDGEGEGGPETWPQLWPKG